MLYMFTESAGLCSGCFLGLQAPPLIMCSLSPEDQRGLEVSGVRATPSLPGGPYLHGSWPLGLPAYLPFPGFLAHLLLPPPPRTLANQRVVDTPVTSSLAAESGPWEERRHPKPHLLGILPDPFMLPHHA